MLRRWLVLANGKLSFVDSCQFMRMERQLFQLTIDVNTVCDLTCEGCYYHPKIDTRRKPVSDKVLRVAILEAAEVLGLRTLVVAGKEPFLNPKKLFSVLELVGSPKKRNYTIGTITNGRHIYRYWDELRQIAKRGHLDFLDISIDSGIPQEHDRLRGRTGTFDLAFNALRHASTQLENIRVGVSAVLFNENEEGLIALIKRAGRWTRYFFVTPIQPPPYSMIAPVSIDVVIKFIRRLHSELETLHLEPGLEITIALPGIYVYDVVGAGLFEWSSVRETPSGSIYTSSSVGDHMVAYILQALPEQAWHVARITSDGAYLGHLHFLQTSAPERHAVGFVQDESISALYDKSVASGSLFDSILQSRERHQCRDRECWPACFGGVTVAENSLFTANHFDKQPKICLKR